MLDTEKLNAFLSSVVNGLPLVLFSVYPDITEIENCLKISEKVYVEYTNVFSNGRLNVERKVSFGEDFSACTKLYLTTKILGLSNKSEASLEDLYKLKKTIFSNKKLDSAISRDLNEIEERVKK